MINKYPTRGNLYFSLMPLFSAARFCNCRATGVCTNRAQASCHRIILNYAALTGLHTLAAAENYATLAPSM